MTKKVDTENIRKKRRNHTDDEVKVNKPTFVIGPNITIINIEINVPNGLSKSVNIIDNLHTVDGISIHKGKTLVVVHGEFVPTDELEELIEFSNITASVANAIVVALYAASAYNIAIDSLNERLLNIELDAARVVYKDPKDSKTKSETPEEDDRESVDDILRGEESDDDTIWFNPKEQQRQEED